MSTLELLVAQRLGTLSEPDAPAWRWCCPAAGASGPTMPR